MFEGGSGDSNAIFIDNLMAEVAVTLQLVRLSYIWTFSSDVFCQDTDCIGRFRH